MQNSSSGRQSGMANSAQSHSDITSSDRSPPFTTVGRVFEDGVDETSLEFLMGRGDISSKSMSTGAGSSGFVAPNYIVDNTITHFDDLLRVVTRVTCHSVDYLTLYTQQLCSSKTGAENLAIPWIERYEHSILTRMRHVSLAFQPAQGHWASADVSVMRGRRLVIFDSMLPSGFQTELLVSIHDDQDLSELSILAHDGKELFHQNDPAFCPETYKRTQDLVFSKRSYFEFAQRVMRLMEVYIRELRTRFPALAKEVEIPHPGLWELVILGYVEKQRDADCGIYTMMHHELLATNHDPVMDNEGQWHLDPVAGGTPEWLKTSSAVKPASHKAAQTYLADCVGLKDVSESRAIYNNYFRGYNQWGLGMLELTYPWLTPGMLMWLVLAFHVNNYRWARETATTEETRVVFDCGWGPVSTSGDASTAACRAQVNQAKHILEHFAYAYGWDVRMNLKIQTLQEFEESKTSLRDWENVRALFLWEADCTRQEASVTHARFWKAIRDYLAALVLAPMTEWKIQQHQQPKYAGPMGSIEGAEEDMNPPKRHAGPSATEDDAPGDMHSGGGDDCRGVDSESSDDDGPMIGIGTVMYGFRCPGVPDTHFRQKHCTKKLSPWYAHCITTEAESVFMNRRGKWAVDSFVGIDPAIERQWHFQHPILEDPDIVTGQYRYMSLGYV